MRLFNLGVITHNIRYILIIFPTKRKDYFKKYEIYWFQTIYFVSEELQSVSAKFTSRIQQLSNLFKYDYDIVYYRNIIFSALTLNI